MGGTKHDSQLREDVFIRDKGHCFYCGMDFTCEVSHWGCFVPDHVIPLKHGGQDILDNVVLSCVQCNYIARDCLFDTLEERKKYVLEQLEGKKKVYDRYMKRLKEINFNELNISQLLEKFVDKIKNNEIEIYNEASVQFELAIFLRQCFGRLLTVQLERNVKYFVDNPNTFYKKEIDVIVSSENNEVKCFIEIKYPQSGQIPEQMYKACKDIGFLEQLKVAAVFNKCYFLMLTEDHKFWECRTNNGIYSYFRKGASLSGRVNKPTGNREEYVTIQQKYILEWKDLRDQLKYLLIEV